MRPYESKLSTSACHPVCALLIANAHIHSARMYAAQALFANELWDGEDYKQPFDLIIR